MRDTIELNGRTYTVRIESDNDMGAPWEENDGHGVVSEWTTRSKRAGELVLAVDQRYGLNGKRRFYNLSATIKTAHADGWGLNDEARAALAARIGREPTKREVVAEAVRLDYEHLRGWCNGSWYWVGVIVSDDATGEQSSLWGMESDDGGGLEECAAELAQDMDRAHAIANRFADAMACGV